MRNVGGVPGDEVAQMYVSDLQSSVVTPDKLLKGFQRIRLRPGETGTVTFRVDPDSLKLLNKQMKWVVEAGDFRIAIGASSEDICLTGIIHVDRTLALEERGNNISNAR